MYLNNNMTDINKDKKLIKLHKLAAELDYKLEKVNE